MAQHNSEELPGSCLPQQLMPAAVCWRLLRREAAVGLWACNLDVGIAGQLQLMQCALIGHNQPYQYALHRAAMSCSTMTHP